MKSNIPIPGDAQINWHLSVEASGRIYFYLSSQEAKTGLLGELDPTAGNVLLLRGRVGFSVEIDDAKRRYLSPGGYERGFVDVGDFSDGTTQSLPAPGTFYSASLSPNRRTLLLSGASLEEAPAIATFDIDAQSEHVLPISGSNAVWLSDKSFFFVKGESELWQFSLADGQERLVFASPAPKQRDGSFATPPDISRSGNLIAWGFATAIDSKQCLRTIVVDLERGEYRLLDGWWHNKAWLE
jgi:dipeptidyl aminopeptidase/acylaminoacyl peptidase